MMSSAKIDKGFWRVFQYMIGPLLPLNNDPICFSNSKMHFVKFGVYSGLGAFVGTFLTLFYLTCKGISIPSGLYPFFILFGLLIWFFSRLLYLLALGKKFFQDPKQYLLDTGLFGQGGILGCFLFFIFLAHYLDKPLLVIADAAAYGGIISLAIGRIGCYNYGCCWGSQTHSCFGVIYTHPLSKVLRTKPHLKGKRLFPTQLLTAFLDLLLFFVFNILLLIDVMDGVLLVLFLLAQPIIRLWMEYYRDDEVCNDGKRNWIPTVMGLLIIFLTSLFLLLNWFGEIHIVEDLSPPVAHTFFAKLFKAATNSNIWACALAAGITVTLLYGWHGKHLGSISMNDSK